MKTLNQEQSVVPNQTKTSQGICETGNMKQYLKYQFMTIWSKKIKKILKIKTAK